jgi:hypothetical protein
MSINQTADSEWCGINRRARPSYHRLQVLFPIKTCTVCGDEFELKPDKPGFADRCPECSQPEKPSPTTRRPMDAAERKNSSEVNEARRQAMRELLYRKDN